MRVRPLCKARDSVAELVVRRVKSAREVKWLRKAAAAASSWTAPSWLRRGSESESQRSKRVKKKSRS